MRAAASDITVRLLEVIEGLQAEMRQLRAQVQSLAEAQGAPAAVTVERAAELLHCSRDEVFSLLKAGRLQRAPRLGKRTLVVYASLCELMAPPVATGPPASPVPRRPPARAARPAALPSAGPAIRAMKP